VAGLQAGDAGGGAQGGVGAIPQFRGVTQLALDAKGRLAVPARHRDTLGNGDARLVITADPSRCLLLYPLAAWEPIQARLMALSSFDERIRSLQRLIVGHADDVELDAAGRILVPAALRQYARLDQHVVLVGQGRRLELWDDAAWQAQTARAIAFPADALPPELDGFSL
jgi:MraZ protein